MINYLIIAECPQCRKKNRFIEVRNQAVGLMHDVHISARYCQHCGYDVVFHEDEWDLHEEAEVKRVKPTQERETPEFEGQVVFKGDY